MPLSDGIKEADMPLSEHVLGSGYLPLHAFATHLIKAFSRPMMHLLLTIATLNPKTLNPKTLKP
jgi:hypothetical protein